jgi:tetratricopeptide (TPR) repeat protein
MDNVNLVSMAGQSYGPSFSLFNITVTFGGSSSPGQGHGELRDLAVPWHDLPENPSIFSLLSWHTRTSKFKGRDEELAELLRWSKDSQKILIKFVTGPGGVGKSRLAAEFATILQRENWAAGFVDLRKPQTFRGYLEGTLLIVDYPEEYRPAVKELFQDLARLHSVERLRVLFLTRQQIGNWEDVIQGTRVESLTDMKPVRLAGLDDVHAHEVYLSASDKIGETFDTDWKPVNQEAIADWLDEVPENDLALFIMAAAVHNILRPEDVAVKYKGPEILTSLVKRELTLFRNLASSCNIPDRYLFARLLAIATIADGISSDRLDAVLAQMDLFQKLPEHFDLACALQNVGFMVNRGIPALKPDIVAAAFVVDVLSRMPEIATELIWLALKEDINGGMQRLSRLSYDAEVVLGLHQYRLSLWLAEAVKDNVERARMLEPFVSTALPIGLLDIAIATWQALLPVTEKQSEKARILNNLSVHLSGVGDKNGAIAANLKAVEIYECLAATNPDAFEPDMAMSLNGLGDRYSELGKRKEALNACLRSVEIYERLAATNPDAFELHLASSLNSLGNGYSELGKREKALD